MMLHEDHMKDVDMMMAIIISNDYMGHDRHTDARSRFRTENAVV